ncbi:hypothetical protein NDU88_001486 [Pleurodeles waltl]|uniref:Uncharacterized protein n=1 Tax=Pleurodeles waltl TaxID=8319 RepID=A0AAV7TIF7_PLEWA|nr:hypothetical protein NDU88_001486 [Pleurodeles waltl]
MGRKRGGPEMPEGGDPEENPGGADRREDWKDRQRPRKSRIGRCPEFLEEERTGADTFTVPTQGRRPLAPGSTRVGPATLQKKRGQARYGVRHGQRGGRRRGHTGTNTTSTDGWGNRVERRGEKKG